MTAQRHDFEGEQLTVAEIRERVPAIGETAIRRNLAAGRNTRSAMLAAPAKRAVKPRTSVALKFGYRR